MVELGYILKVRKALEAFYIRENDYNIDGSTFSIILFIPLVQHGDGFKYNLILSAQKLDSYPKKQIIIKVFSWFSSQLTKAEQAKIESLIILSSDAPFVRQVEMLNPLNEELKEIRSIELADVEIDYGILVSSPLLEKAQPNRAIIAILDNGMSLNMGVDQIDENFRISFYTGKALREMFAYNNLDDSERQNAEKLKQLNKAQLKKLGYYDHIDLSSIQSIR